MDFFKFEDFCFGALDHILSKAGKRIHLTPKAAAVLYKLLEKQGQLATKDELKKAGWSEAHVTDDNLHRKLSEVRRALGETDQHRYIETISKIGYRFDVAVTFKHDIVAGTDPGAPAAPPASAEFCPANEATSYDGLMLRARSSVGASKRSRRPLAGAALAVFTLIVVGLLLVRAPHWPEALAVHQITHDGRPKAGPLLVDGSRAYFVEIINSRNVLASTTVGSGVDLLSPPIPENGPLLFDLDSHTGELLLAYMSGQERRLWTWVPGRPWARPLVNGGIFAGAFSPDGRRLAVTAVAPDRLEIIDRASLQPLYRLTIPTPDNWVRYAPNGKGLRFTVSNQTDETTSFWEMDESQRTIRPVERDDANVRSVRGGVWSPDGEWFVFDGGSGNHQSDLWVSRSRSVQHPGNRELLRRLTHVPIRFQWPVNAADRNHIFAIGSSRRAEAVRFDVSTQTLSPFLPAFSAVDVSLSYDGQSVAFIDEWDGTVWRATSGGRAPVQLTFPPLQAFQPHWSPDGRRIAFMGKPPQGHWRVYVVPSTGGVSSPVADLDDEQGVPSWSADGRYIVFGDRLYQRPNEQMHLHLLDYETRSLSTLPGSQGKWTGRWSPDGKHIVAQSPDFHALYLYDVRARTWSELAHLSSFDCLNWSWDSKYIYYLLRKPAKDGCYRMRISDGKTEEVFAFDDHPELDQSWLSVAPDGSPILDRVVNTQEIYSIEVKWP